MAENNGVVFRCERCELICKSRGGLSVHMRRKHPDEYHSSVQETTTRVKTRWTKEEELVLAVAEVKILKEEAVRGHGVPFGINALLARIHAGRSEEAIKGRRKMASYKRVVENLMLEVVPGGGNLLDQSQSRDNEFYEFNPSHNMCTPTLQALTQHLLNTINTTTYANTCPKLQNMCHFIARCVEEMQSSFRIVSFNDFNDFSEENIIFNEQCLIKVWELLDEMAVEMIGYVRQSGRGAARRGNPPQYDNNRGGRRARRRQVYKDLQNLYYKDRSKCAKMVMEGKWRNIGNPEQQDVSRDQLRNYWLTLFARPSEEDERGLEVIVEEQLWQLQLPIEIEEFRKAIVESNSGSAPGPDGWRVKDMQMFPDQLWVDLFNIWLFTGYLPREFRKARTVLIPKVNHPVDPSEYRPITISSIIVRVFHRILAARCVKWVPLHNAQKAFLPTDGLAQNVMLLDAIISESKSKCKPMCAMFLDVRKAYDSVNHSSVKRALQIHKIPKILIEYVMSTYKDAETEVMGQQGQMCRGVKQGDPLSCILFNMVMNEALVKLNKEIGWLLSGEEQKVSALAFADDVVLVAESEQGLNMQVQLFLGQLRASGLEINPLKCATLKIQTVPKVKKWYVDTKSKSVINGVQIRTLQPTSVYKYLGMSFSSAGRGKPDLSVLTQKLKSVDEAPLKPQQRLFILNKHLIPAIIHTMVLGGVCQNTLKAADRSIRCSVRKWLKLPHDTSLGVFYAPVASGGLGCLCLSTRVPILRRNRLDAFHNSDDRNIRNLALHPNTLKAIRFAGKSRIKNAIVNTNKQELKEWTKALLSSLDGAGLQEHQAVPQVHQWMANGTSLLKGAAFIDAIKIKHNLMATKTRRSRGHRNIDTRCQGCGQRESLGHLLQVCPQLHGQRVRRHDNIVDAISTDCMQCKHAVVKEPRITTTSGVRKPDLVICNLEQRKAYVLDVKIASDSAITTLQEQYERKAGYYDTGQIRDWAARWATQQLYMQSQQQEEAGHPSRRSIQQIDPQDIVLGAVIITWRGVMSPRSYKVLKELKLPLNKIQLYVIKALEGSITQWRMYNQWGGLRAP